MDEEQREDRDNVRLDLLKVRQKVYEKLQPGSDEHKAFIRSMKTAELGHLSQKLPPEMVEFVMEAARYVIKFEIKKVLKFAIPGFAVLALNFFLSTVLEHTLATIVALYLLYHAGVHTGHLLGQLRELGALKQNWDKLDTHMKRLTNDLKRLEGPEA